MVLPRVVVNTTMLRKWAECVMHIVKFVVMALHDLLTTKNYGGKSKCIKKYS